MNDNTGTRRFEYKDEKSSKFWEISVEGNKFTVRYGKLGTDGQTQTREFADAATAEKQAQKLITEKTGKGYQEVSADGTTSSRIDLTFKQNGSKPIKATPKPKKLIKITKAMEVQRQRINEAMSILDPILNDKDVRDSTKTRIRFVLDVVQPTYYYGLREAPPNEMNRFGNMVGGWPYTSQKYPWPGGDSRYPPFLQLNLKDISEYSNEDLGEGLLQIWASHTCSLIRVVESEDLQTPPSNEYFDTGILKIGEDGSSFCEMFAFDDLPHARRNSIISIGKPEPTVIPYFEAYSKFQLDDEDLNDEYLDLVKKAITIVRKYFPKFPHLYFFGAQSFIQSGYGFYIDKCVKEGWRPLMAFFSDAEDLEFSFDGRAYLLYRIFGGEREFFFYWDR